MSAPEDRLAEAKAAAELKARFDALQASYENHRREEEAWRNKLDARLERIEGKIDGRLATIEEKVHAKMQTVAPKTLVEQHDRQIRSLENWRSVLVGAGAVIGFAAKMVVDWFKGGGKA